MDRDQALRLLGLRGAVTPEELKSTFRRRAAELDERIARAATNELRAEYRAARENIERAVAAVHPDAHDQPDPSSSQPVGEHPASHGPRGDAAVTERQAPSAHIHLPVGRHLANRFELRRRVGVGPLGAVFAALDHDCGKEVALKAFLPEVLQDEPARQCLIRETERASRMSHRGIVDTFGIHRDGELHFVTMELLEGVTLRQRMDTLRTTGQRFPVNEVVCLGVALCEALEYAHQHTVHCGVKPENIFLCDDGPAQLTDFGIARLLQEGRRTVAAMSIRAASYMAPEQLKGSKSIDHRTDQYSTAAVLYEMLTGELPVGRVKAAKERRPDIPRALSRALGRALEPDPNDRFANMAAFGGALTNRRSGRANRAKLWVIALVILSVVVAGVTFPRWRDRVGLMVRKALQDPEAQAVAESTGMHALASASSWQRIAGLLPEGQWPKKVAEAEAALAEGNRYLEAMDYSQAAFFFRQAFELYDARVAAATQLFRDEPARVAATARALHERLDMLERQLYDRLAESSRRLDACTQNLNDARTGDEREAMAARRRSAETEVKLVARLVALTRATVLDGPARQKIADKLDRADQVLEAGRYRAALSAYAEVKAQLEELLAWPSHAEQALHEQSAISQQMKRFRSALGSLALEMPEVQSGLDAAAALAAKGADKLAEGRVEEAIALFKSARRHVLELKADVVTGLLSRAREYDAEGMPTAAVLALDELLALDPSHIAGQQLRRRILSHRVTNSVDMEFVFIPPGEFLMGSPADELGRDEDESEHLVKITTGYYLSTTEVTQAQWLAVMQDNPSRWEGEDLPVERVSWQDAMAFCERLSRVEGRRHRLPTEAEWEYACRARTTTPFSFRQPISTRQANYDGGYAYGNGPKGIFRDKTVPVGSFPPNAWGLYDMHGNVWEWCSDMYEGVSPGLVRDAVGEDAIEGHVLRGGSWRHRPRYCRSANRVWGAADSRLDILGFRLVLESE